jgi:two-component system chemotaxis response regulator CheB
MRGGAAGFVVRPDAERPLALKAAAEEILSLIDPHRRRTRPGDDASARPGRQSDRRGGEADTISASPGQAFGRVAMGEDRRKAGEAGIPGARRAAVSPQVLVVASSTGGPQALIDLFRQVPPAAMPLPVLVVQHMPAAFTPILAEHLSRATAWRASEARDDEPLTAGEIRIAPGGYHLVVTGSGCSRRLRLTGTPPVNFCRPSADVLFVSAAEAFGRHVLAVILTGMGNDGAEGAKVIAAAGGIVFAQDRKTSVVWGMPGAAVATGIVDKVLPLESMPQAMAAATKGTL